MTDHYVALLNWDVREHWPEVAPKDAAGRPVHPYAYGSCHSYFEALAREKPVLWVVASPDYGSGSKRLPPTIIARLQIKCVRCGAHSSDLPRSGRHLLRPQDYNWVAEADPHDPNSKYFPINNAFHELTTVRFIDARGVLRRIPPAPRHAANPYSHVPMYLRNIRHVFRGDEHLLEDLARRVAKRRTVFLSYSHDDSHEFARELADELRLQDFAPWIDFETIPELRSGVGQYGKSLLAQMMADGIRQAGLVVVIRSRHYGCTPWTHYEWKTIHRPPWHGPPIRVLEVARRTPALAARLVAQQWYAWAGAKTAVGRRSS